jgi:hypothetical protein
LRRRLQQPIARLSSRVDSFRPRAVQLQDLGAPDEALPAIRHEIWLGLTPTRQGGRPLLRSMEIENLQASFDDAAVHVADHERRHLASVDGDHGLVEQTHAVLDLAHADQHPAAAMPRERDQIAIAKTVADLGGLTEHAIATGRIAGEHTLQREGKEQVPLFDAVLVCALEQLAPPRDPAARARRGASGRLQSRTHIARRARRRRAPGTPGAHASRSPCSPRPCRSGTRRPPVAPDRRAEAPHPGPLPT